ncbi:unnamed protein product [Urochloa humidicola]
MTITTELDCQKLSKFLRLHLRRKQLGSRLREQYVEKGKEIGIKIRDIPCRLLNDVSSVLDFVPMNKALIYSVSDVFT